MSLLAQTSTQQLVTSSITAVTARFQTLSTLVFNVSSINGIVPGAAFNGSTIGLSSATVNTSSLQTSNLRSAQGYISSLVVDSLAIGSNNGFVDMGDVITTSLSSIQINTGFFTASGPVCTPQIIVSTINGQTFGQPIQSTMIGLATAGYISSTQLYSTVQGIGSGFTGSTVGLSAATINVSSIRSINISSVQGYISSFRTDSLTVGGPTGYVNIQDLITGTASTGQIVAGAGFISSLQINSLSFGPSGYVIVGDVIANSLSTKKLNTQALYANNAYIGNVSSQSAILFPGIDGTYRGTAIAEQTTGVGTQELLLYKVSSLTDQIRLQTTGNLVFEVGAPSRSWNSTTQLATPSLYIQGSTSNVGVGTATPATTFDVVGTGRFQILSTLGLNVSSINGSAPWQQSFTTSTVQGLGNLGYISSAHLTSTFVGLGSAGYISSPQLASTVRGLTITAANAFTGSTISLSAGTIFVSSLSMNTTLMSTMSMVDTALVSTTGNVTQQNLILYFNAMPFAGTQAWFGQMIIPPGPPLTSIFPYTGAAQTWVVPTSVNSVNAYMWGAGGGGVATASGGAGAFIQAAVPVTPGETLTLIVGGGGGVASTTATYGGGGAGGGGGFGTQGGGRTAIQRGSIGATDYVVVGAGGGGTGYSSAGAGGPGGISAGSAATGTTGLEGQGGTQSAGGAGSSGVISAGSAGSAGAGGAAGAYGGGGGSGYYGGGGSGATSGIGGSGGGGSSFVNNVLPITLTAGSGASAPGTSIQYYTAPVAAGGTSIAGTGGNGLIVLSYTAAPPAAPGGLTLTLNGTTATLSWTSAGTPLYYWAFYGNSTSAYTGTYLMSGSTSGTSVNYSISTTFFDYFRLVSLSPLGCISQIVSSPIIQVPAPSGLTLTASGATVTMSWSAVSGATSYTYTLYSNSIFAYGGSSVTTGSVSGVTATYSSGSAGTYYYFTVSATTSYGTSLSTTSDIVQNVLNPSATGGTIVTSGSTKYHIFTTTGTFALTSPSSLSVTPLIIAGGGGGGTSHGGGGGAGEVAFSTTTITNTSYSVVVGSGGGATANGLSSVVFTISANGGGAGASSSSSPGSNGGSGGGGSGFASSINPGSSVKTAGGLGNAGGSAYNDGQAGGGGGGGGAGSVGSNAATSGSTQSYLGGPGGNGTITYSTLISIIRSSMPNDWQTATSGGYIAAGGGGGNWARDPFQPGGLGGGGSGGNNNGGTYVTPTNAINNTGSGGGGGGSGGQVGASGGSGLVVITYGIAPASPTNLTITPAVGNTATLSWTPSSGATGYSWALYQSATNGYFGTSVLTGSTTSTTYTATATGLNFNYYYYFTVIATGSPNSAAAVSPIMYELPDAPSGLTITTSSTTLTMSWSATSGALYYIYTVYQATAYTYTATLMKTANNGTSLSATYTGIAGNYYYFTLSVTTANGTSALSTSGITQVTANSVALATDPSSSSITPSIISGYSIYSFTTVGTNTFTLLTPTTVSTQTLIVAGGGGGGANTGAGGGAGGVINSNVSLSSATYSVVVGGGGTGATTTSPGYAGTAGSNSSFNSLIAIGGGAGGGEGSSYPPTTGGSGGGGGWGTTGASGTSGQGYAGGNGVSGPNYPGGGGGGAGGAGGNGNSSTSVGGAGGIGQSYTVGGNVYTLGGGGGGGADIFRVGSALGGTGVNGGGNGAGASGAVAVAGTANTGGGGGGGADIGTTTRYGANGGSGIVVIAIPAPQTPPTNPTLVISGTTATMSWTVTSGATGYSWNLYQSATNTYAGTSFTTGTTTSAVTATATGLTLGNFYYFTVTATTSTLPSPAVGSAVVQCVPNPYSLTLSVTSTGATMGWSSTGSSPSFTYVLYQTTFYSYTTTTTTITSNTTSSSSVTYSFTPVANAYYYYTLIETTTVGTSPPYYSPLTQYGTAIINTSASATYTTLAGSSTYAFADGTGTGASFSGAWGLARMSNNTIVVADVGNNRIRLVTYPGAVVTTLAGSGTGTFADGTGAAASFWEPSGVAVLQDGNVVVADGKNNRIRLVTYPGGVVTTLAGSGSAASTNGTGTGASFNWPLTIIALQDGKIAVGESASSSSIRLVTYPGGVVTNLTSGVFNNVQGLVQSIDGNTIYAAQYGNSCISAVTYPGGVVTTLISGLSVPRSMAMLTNSLLAVCELNNNRIQYVTCPGGVGTPLASSIGGGGLIFLPNANLVQSAGANLYNISGITLSSPTTPTLSIVSGTATLGWTAVSGATGYSWILYKSSTNTYSGSSAATGTTTSAVTATSSGLSSGFFWYFTVSATIGSSNSLVTVSSIIVY